MRGNKFYIFSALALFAGYLWLGWNLYGAANTSIGSVCLFKSVTGLPCPSCGTTRALVEVAKGDLVHAFMINPFGILFAVIMVISPFWLLYDLLRDRQTLYRCWTRGETLLRERYWLWAPSALLLVVNWVWNIRKGL